MVLGKSDNKNWGCLQVLNLIMIIITKITFVTVFHIKEESLDDELIVQVDPLLLLSDIREDGSDKVCWVKSENKINEDQDKGAEILIISDAVTQEPYNVKSEIQTYQSDPISDNLSIKNESSPYDAVSKC